MPAIPSTTLERDGASLTVALVPWDTASFGFPVAQIERIDIGSGTRPVSLFGVFEDWCATHDVGLVSCRLDHSRLRESMALEDAGFRFVETVLGPRLAPLIDLVAPQHELVVAAATAEDLDAIETIAAEAFTTGRFLLDWRLDPGLSRRRYAGWVRSSFENAAHSVLKAELDGNLVGFFIVERRANQSVYWHLTAMATRSQGKGLGLSLWRTMLLRHRDAGATSVETTISGHNLPAINLYARLGFSFASTQMTYHLIRRRA